MLNEKTNSMVCPDCDGRGYIKINDKTKKCERCKGTGLLYNKKEKNK